MRGIQPRELAISPASAHHSCGRIARRPRVFIDTNKLFPPAPTGRARAPPASFGVEDVFCQHDGDPAWSTTPSEPHREFGPVSS
jgi:hypothetical protein